MRVAILTDIHGNWHALGSVLTDLRRVAPDVTVFAGDVALFGSAPTRCWDAVHDAGWPIVQGNTDRYIFDLDGKLATMPPENQAVREALRAGITWVRAEMGQERVAQLGGMAKRFDIAAPAGAVLVVHGSLGNDEVGFARFEPDTAFAARLPEPAPDVLVCGHTHTAFVRTVGRTLLVNCGSIGRTYDGIPGIATYAVLDDASGRWSATIQRVPYPNKDAYDALRNSSAPVSETVGASLLTGRIPDAE